MHSKEDRILRAGVADAYHLYSHLAIALGLAHLRLIGHTPDYLWCGCTSVSAHPILGTSYVSICRYKCMRLLTSACMSTVCDSSY